jgi:uncharacterized protein
MLCPICKIHQVDENERDRKGSLFPFCSERCKLIDLGRWLSGKYQIPVSQEEESKRSGGDSGQDDEEL